MIKYLIAILDKNAASFCHYENPAHCQPGTELMPINILKDTVDYAARNGISVNFIYGNANLPAIYTELVESIDHVKIAPLKLLKEIKAGIFIINKEDINNIKEIEVNTHLNLILRLEREQLAELSEIFHSLLGKFKRLNLCLLNIEDYLEEDLKNYENELKKIEKYAEGLYKAGKMVEINFISDRLMLQNMNNCNAGVNHLTVAPNGKLYLCPGFYYFNENDSVGTLQQEIKIGNGQLLKLNHAAICMNCDAFHCKRCIYLNKVATFEINTPSRQQCVISHLERNVSMHILEALKPTVEVFQKFVPIPAVPYLDPYEILNDIMNRNNDYQGGERLIAELLSKPLAGLSTQELLYQIYLLNKELLIQLKIYNHSE